MSSPPVGYRGRPTQLFAGGSRHTLSVSHLFHVFHRVVWLERILRRTRTCTSKLCQDMITWVLVHFLRCSEVRTSCRFRIVARVVPASRSSSNSPFMAPPPSLVIHHLRSCASVRRRGEFSGQARIVRRQRVGSHTCADVEYVSVDRVRRTETV